MRIVSLVPSATETLFQLGLDQDIVGITTFCHLPADKVRQKPRVGGTKDPEIQKIAELKPDVVIVNMEENRKEDADAIRDLGFELLVTFPNTLEESIESIEVMGERFGAKEKTSAMAREIRDLMSSLKPRRRYRALTFIWRSPYMTIKRGTYVDSICSFFGFDNVMDDPDSKAYPELSSSDILSLDPEVVLFPDEPYAFREKHVEEFIAEFPQIHPATILFDGVYVTWHSYGTLRALREFPAVLKAAGLWQ